MKNNKIGIIVKQKIIDLWNAVGQISESGLGFVLENETQIQISRFLFLAGLGHVVVAGWGLNSGFGVWIDTLVLVGIYILANSSLMYIFTYFQKWIVKLPGRVIGSMIAASIASYYLWEPLIEHMWEYLGALLILAGLGGIGYAAFTKPVKGRLQKLAVGIVMLAGFASLTLFWGWVLGEGSKSHLLELDVSNYVTLLDSPSPLEPGPHQVSYLTYGSGEDLRRPEFGADANLITRSVNAERYVSMTDTEEKSRDWYWGFSENQFPINGRVWYPEGQGPFPLVLIVHGNHNMNDYSDPGYEYLGELLASRGYIFVSVDENFFNYYVTGGLSGENDGRAWVLLQHLTAWKQWNLGLEENPFAGKVDMENIALIGHSRGGEAVAVAAAMNRLPYNPDNGLVEWDYQFNIRTVIGIAPSDQQYVPADHPVPLENINYLVLQGAHDGDVLSYIGLRQYQRVTFTESQDEWVKAGVYIYQANHSRFNGVWGESDLSLPRSLMLNRAPLLEIADQQQIAQMYISAFLDLTLRGQTSYLPIFQNHRVAASLLPETLYANQFADSSYKILANYQGDIDLTTADEPGTELQAFNVSRWRELELEFRTGREQDNHVVELRWDRLGGRYEVFLPIGWAQENLIDQLDSLVFMVADARTPEEFQRASELIDFDVELVDAFGESARLQLLNYYSVMPQFPSVFSKLPDWEQDKYEKSSEPILQSVSLPLSEFVLQNRGIQLDRLVKIVFRFNRLSWGEIYLDDIGFSLP